MSSRSLVVILCCLLLQAGCSVKVDVSGTSFRCDETPLCPEGQSCVDGVCLAGGVDVDADVDADAGPGGSSDSGAPPADAATAGRVIDGLQLLYRLGGGQAGDVIVNDESGAGAPYDLTLADPDAVTWLPDSVRIDSPTIFSGSAPATKVIDACVATDEITMEAFARAANLAQTGPARIATLSLDTASRNASLMQETTAFAARLRTTELELNGNPTFTGGTVSTEALQHVAYVRLANGTEAIYVDGVEQVAGTRAGDHKAWDTTYPFAIGNELTLNRAWLGEIALIAVYCRALSPEEIQQNLAAGL